MIRVVEQIYRESDSEVSSNYSDTNYSLDRDSHPLEYATLSSRTNLIDILYALTSRFNASIAH